MSHDIVIYHNPRCSKSRETLALLQQHGVTPCVVLYLDTPPDTEQIRQLLSQLGFSSARELMRQKEDMYRELNLSDTTLSETQLIAALVEHPKLIERPIVVNGERVCIGRPPEQVLALL
ncbi:arsenate reductase (glutaredoxin) [BEV proteobacterium]|nr:arsenate reductase (glutaredoxin) [Candidatus Symbiopectobacterium sp. Chty_BC]